MHKLHKLSGMAPNSATCEKMRCIPQKNEKPESEIDGSRSLPLSLAMQRPTVCAVQPAGRRDHHNRALLRTDGDEHAPPEDVAKLAIRLQAGPRHQCMDTS